MMAKHSGSKSRMPSFKSWLHHLLFGTNTGKLNNCFAPKFPPMQIWIIQYLSHTVVVIIKKLIYIKHLEDCLAHSKHPFPNL